MDADRRKVVWENLYRKIYTGDNWEFWRLIDFENIKNGKARFKSNVDLSTF